MMPRARLITLAMGGTAIAVALLAGFLSRESIANYLELRKIVQVCIDEDMVGFFQFVDPVDVKHALLVTKKFVGSLPAIPDPALLGYRSCVLFRSSKEDCSSQDVVYSIFLVPDPQRFGAIRHREGEERYGCSVSEWCGYIRDLLKPAAHDLLQAWQKPDVDFKKRLQTASALALLAPDTPGLVEFFCSGLVEEKIFARDAILLLEEMGASAAKAVPVLSSLTEALDDETRVVLKAALSRIRGEPQQQDP